MIRNNTSISSGYNFYNEMGQSSGSHHAANILKLANNSEKEFGTDDFNKDFLSDFEQIPKDIKSKFCPFSSILQVETPDTRKEKTHNILLHVSAYKFYESVSELKLTEEQLNNLKALNDTLQIVELPHNPYSLNTQDEGSKNYKNIANLAGKLYFSLTQQERSMLGEGRFFNFHYEIPENNLSVKLNDSYKLQNLTVSRASTDKDVAVVDVDTAMIVNANSTMMKICANSSGAKVHANVAGVVPFATADGAVVYAEAPKVVATASAAGAKAYANVAGSTAIANVAEAIANANAIGAIAIASVAGAKAKAIVAGATALGLAVGAIVEN